MPRPNVKQEGPAQHSESPYVDLSHIYVKFFEGNTEKNQSVTANARNFSSGSRGFGWYGKLEFNGKRYQVSLNVIEVGSKPSGGQ